MKSINKILMKAKLKHYKYIKREQEHDLDLKTKMSKCIANASFYKYSKNSFYYSTGNHTQRRFHSDYKLLT